MAQRVAIVGGGVIGIACAHYLSDAGYAVTVIDQDRIGGGCSHGNCGHICASHVLPLNEPANLLAALGSLVNPRAPFRVRPQWRPALLRWFWEFARRCNHRHTLSAGGAMKSILDASIREYEALFEVPEFEAQWQPLGLLYVLRTRRGMDRFAAQDAMLRDTFGVAARRIEGGELPELEPALRPGLAGGVPLRGRCLSAARCADRELESLAHGPRRTVRGKPSRARRRDDRRGRSRGSSPTRAKSPPTTTSSRTAPGARQWRRSLDAGSPSNPARATRSPLPGPGPVRAMP